MCVPTAHRDVHIYKCHILVHGNLNGNRLVPIHELECGAISNDGILHFQFPSTFQ